MERGPFTNNYLPGNKKDAGPFFVGFLGLYEDLMRLYYLEVIELLVLTADCHCMPDPKTLTLGEKRVISIK